ncbi:MAG TPA: dihydrodipicolinate synthase family protein [Xanthobacteraceae bacterium]|jgi:dihydrodipicolinate synthase/N-acetylneuraminate lyase
MLGAGDIGGMMAMMPSFATDEAANLRATDTVSVERLRRGLDRMIRDGADVIATTGSFGECHALLAKEFETLARESADVVRRRVPLFIGVTSVNARETVEKMRIVADTAADGALIGVPYYFPSTVENAVRFFRELAEMFPKLNILIYHNPALHHVTLPVEAFEDLVKIPQIVGMKDSHRDTTTFMKLMKIIRGKIGVMVHQAQYVPYAELGAVGFWSIDAWMGPWPLFALRDAVARGDIKAAKDIILDIAPPTSRAPSLSWRETAAKIAIGMAGYVEPGPLRPPFLEIPAEVIEAQRKRVERWQDLCAKYAPSDQAAPRRAASA